MKRIKPFSFYFRSRNFGQRNSISPIIFQNETRRNINPNFNNTTIFKNYYHTTNFNNNNNNNNNELETKVGRNEKNQDESTIALTKIDQSASLFLKDIEEILDGLSLENLRKDVVYDGRVPSETRKELEGKKEIIIDKLRVRIYRAIKAKPSEVGIHLILKSICDNAMDGNKILGDILGAVIKQTNPEYAGEFLYGITSELTPEDCGVLLRHFLNKNNRKIINMRVMLRPFQNREDWSPSDLGIFIGKSIETNDTDAYVEDLLVELFKVDFWRERKHPVLREYWPERRKKYYKKQNKIARGKNPDWEYCAQVISACMVTLGENWHDEVYFDILPRLLEKLTMYHSRNYEPRIFDRFIGVDFAAEVVAIISNTLGRHNDRTFYHKLMASAGKGWSEGETQLLHISVEEKLIPVSRIKKIAAVFRL